MPNVDQSSLSPLEKTSGNRNVGSSSGSKFFFFSFSIINLLSINQRERNNLREEMNRIKEQNTEILAHFNKPMTFTFPLGEMPDVDETEAKINSKNGSKCLVI